jgi:integral membrane protein (TIGR01906 family)
MRFEKLNAVILGGVIWIVLVITALQVIGFHPDFYREQYLHRNTAEEIGVSFKDLMTVTEVLLDYTAGQREDLDVVVDVNGTLQPFFNQREIDHMVDVRVLYHNVLLIRDVLGFFLIINLVTMFLLEKRIDTHRLMMGLLGVTVVLGVLLLAIGLYAIIDFDAFWTQFHHVFFTNDLWLLDPRTDNLINLVPTGFFIDLIVTIVTVFGVMLGGLFALLKGITDKGLSHNTLKWIAVVTMTIDHVGFFLFPEIRLLRIIGRLAFPIFAYLFTQSFRYTEHRNQLLGRLIGFAVAGQVLIITAGVSGFVNVLFLFALAWIALLASDHGYPIVGILVAIIAELAAGGLWCLRHSDHSDFRSLSRSTVRARAWALRDSRSFTFSPIILRFSAQTAGRCCGKAVYADWASMWFNSTPYSRSFRCFFYRYKASHQTGDRGSVWSIKPSSTCIIRFILRCWRGWPDDSRGALRAGDSAKHRQHHAHLRGHRGETPSDRTTGVQTR